LLAPILVYVYDRLNHLMNCVESLRANPEAKDSILYVASDGAASQEDKEKIDSVRKYILKIKGFHRVMPLFRANNLGSYYSCLNAERHVLHEHNKFIGLEDDIIVATNFLDYMNRGLDFYENDKRILSIHGHTLPISIPQKYNKDIYLCSRFNGWGFGIWKDRWDMLDLRISLFREFHNNTSMVLNLNKQDSAVIPILMRDWDNDLCAVDCRITLNMFIKNMYAVAPVKPLSVNRGFDGTGKRCTYGSIYQDQALALDRKRFEFEKDLKISDLIQKEIAKHNGNITRCVVFPILRRLGISRILKKYRPGWQ